MISRRLLPVLLVLCGCAAVAAPAPAGASEVTFEYSGEEEMWMVPAGVTSIDVEAVGAEGANGFYSGGEAAAGGRGAVVTGQLQVRPGQRLFARVGGSGGPYDGGFNGGGDANTYGGAGGGATDIRTVPGEAGQAVSLESRLLVAGGGGGGGGYPEGAAGGDAGGTGGDAPIGSGNPEGGKGGDPGALSAGGAGGDGGSGDVVEGATGEPGELGEGGDNLANLSGGGGGGGGGLYGGGAGGTGGRSSAGVNAAGGGGGGGSSLVPAEGSSEIASPGTPPRLTIRYELGPPTAQLGDAVPLGPRRVLLLGSAESLLGVVSTHFEYGTDISYGETTPDSPSTFVSLASAVLTGLRPDTTYHYRLVASRSDGVVTRSADATVTTMPAPPDPPDPPGGDSERSTDDKDEPQPPAARPKLRLLERARVRADKRGRAVLRLRCGTGAGPCTALLAARWGRGRAVRRLVVMRPGARRAVRVPAPRGLRRSLRRGARLRLRVLLAGFGRTEAAPLTGLVRVSRVAQRPRPLRPRGRG